MKRDIVVRGGAAAGEAGPVLVRLDAKQRATLAEALNRGEETRDVMEDALVGFGRWVLLHVFDDDAGKALDDRSKNPVWMHLVHHAGGPKLRLGQKLLYVALHIAARDRRITDEAWRNLEPGRKQLLLPLGDEAKMREAARHVTAMKLSQRATGEYVAALRAEAGDAPKTRVTAKALAARVKRFREGLGRRGQVAQIERALRDADDGARKAAEGELRALRDWADGLLRKRG